ncbi:alpha/beta fold hydrolase [Marinobacter subterrani]|uniref:Pimeloyl-ACP methyl ester carboxylesterase n=1 Tax=Marinobacter subterrani TaxID=1658765 RepID=A0A0J7M6W3_9GAMM|nr:alpha/beta hydrolase [Marinobacter subterrani]KMQ76650.1 Pimeloyl-ACP methyl ester carboxylesterase [Marinobacter subterrani]
MTYSPSPSHDLCTLVLEDGRRLAYSDYGAPSGYPVIFAHGMPGSRLEGRFFDEQARAAGFRILALDRPGIGASNYQPDRRLLDYSDDVGQFADQLELASFVHMGWSSGGSRTLACAYSLGDRISQAVVLSGYTHFAELPDSHTLLLKTRWPGPVLAELSTPLFRAVVDVVVWISRRRPGIYLRKARSMVSEQDRQLLEDETLRHYFREDQIACLDSGGRAIATDLLTEMTDWGFRLAQVPVPTLIYQGQQDPFVPERFAHHMAEHITGADLNLLPESGHLYPLDPGFQAGLFHRLQDILGLEAPNGTRTRANEANPV